MLRLAIKTPLRCFIGSWLTGLLLLGAVIWSSALLAQPVVDRSEDLASDRPESWAMAYMSATTLFSGFSSTREREPWSFAVGAELGHVPHLSSHKRRVGFDGTKLEDLNKSPVFGTVRVQLALPEDFAVEFGWTPPVRVGGAEPDQLFAIAVERALLGTGEWELNGRLFHQRGRVEGDFTCDRVTASFPPGSEQNPFGCREPSSDRFTLNQSGLELALSRSMFEGLVTPRLAYAATYMRPRTQVEAATFGVLDRSVLTTSTTVHTWTAGGTFRPSSSWELGAAVAWTPLHARRPPDQRRSTHDLWSARVMMRRWF